MKSVVNLDNFVLPNTLDAECLAQKDSQICVVSVIGKSSFNSSYSRDDLINDAMQKEMFYDALRQAGVSDISLLKLCQIHGHFDARKRTVYLNLVSAFDAQQLGHICETSSDELLRVGFRRFFENAEFTYTRAVLYLFSVSHIVMFVQPGPNFDLKYIRLFRLLEKTRQKLQSYLKDVLVEFPVSKEWASEGRFCCPRVLFVVEMRRSLNSDLVTSPSSPDVPKDHLSAAKKMQQKLEDQIYRALRRSHVVGDSRSLLFALPANQEFVFVRTHPSAHTDPIAFYLNHLKNTCISAAVQSGTPSPRFTQGQGGGRVRGDGSMTLLVKDEDASSEAGSGGLYKFLSHHVDIALTKGFDDSTSRTAAQPFELPTLGVWLAVVQSLHSFFLTGHGDPRVQPHFAVLNMLLDVDVRFSESRCEKVLPQALAAYQEGLPSLYIRAMHETKLQQARRIFQQHARGPAFDAYLHQLEDECETLWRSGRQMCEAVSLTGNHCMNELHRLPDDTVTDDNRDLPVSTHSSQVKVKAACNCGATQAERDDPFDHKYANYDFYKRLAVACCQKLEQYEMPVSVSPAAAACDDGTNPRPPVTFIIAKAPLPSSSLTSVEQQKDEETTPAVATETDAVATTTVAAATASSSTTSFDVSHVSPNITFPITSTTNNVTPAASGAVVADDVNSKLDLDLLYDLSALSLNASLSQPTGGGGNVPMMMHDVNLDSAVTHDDAGVAAEDEQGIDVDGETEIPSAAEAGAVGIASSHIDNTSPPSRHHDDQEQEEEDGSAVSMTTGVKSPADMLAERQPSTLDYLATMTSSESPPGLLPRFPSWSLVALGDFSTYQTSKGLEQPNFIPGSNYLLYLDIGGGVGGKWPQTQASERGGKAWSSRPKKAAAGAKGQDITRIYLGFEYECPRGHRYILSSPDKLQRAQTAEVYKESALKVLSSSMPLYFPCQCRSNKPSYGQLMRMFIALPESCPEVKVNALVQPHPPPCPTFHCGVAGGITLTPGKVWVLRFPFVYVGETGSFPMPHDIKHADLCRVATKNILIFIDSTD